MYQRSESEIERKIKENKHEIKTYDCLDYVVKWAVITTGTVFAILGLNKFYEYASQDPQINDFCNDLYQTTMGHLI